MNSVMKATSGNAIRRQAIERARAESPFLRAAAGRWPDIADIFEEEGADPAIAAALVVAGDDVAATLRRRSAGQLSVLP